MSDGYPIRGRLWPGDGTCDTAVIYLHGIQSHGGWYEWSGSLLAGGGMTVLMPDRRGSGLNGEARGDVANARRWLEDLEELADWLATAGTEARPTGGAIRRVALVGVSWGGKLAAAWAHERPERAAGMLLIAPGLFPRVDLRMSKKFAVAWSVMTSPTELYDIPLADSTLFTGNPAGVRFIDSDPLQLRQVTARFLRCSAQLDRRLVRLGRGAIQADAEMVLSGQDRIIRSASTQRWLSRVCARPPTVETLALASHTIEFENDIGDFERILLGWRRRLHDRGTSLSAE
jgi:alpha-beta hydrolase superfamily lysophospholipase